MRAAIAPLPHLENRPRTLAIAFLLAALIHALICVRLVPKYERRDKTSMQTTAIELDAGLLERIPANGETRKKQQEYPREIKKPEIDSAASQAPHLRAEAQKIQATKKPATAQAAKPAKPGEKAVKANAANRSGRNNKNSEPATKTHSNAAPKAATATPPTPWRGAANPKPQYPLLARKRGQEGTVRVLCQVDASGNVTSVALAQGSGFRLLDKAALKTARLWKFRPAQKNGANVTGEITISIEFRLLDN